jgi:hypothetical protein
VISDVEALAPRNAVTRAIVGSLAILILLVPAHAFGQGGPPLITDDPDTPGPGYWEINLAAIVEQSLSERRTEQPLADINYGVGRRIQLKFEIPWLHVREHGESAGTGPGNPNSGVKWRFLGEEGKRVAWSIYPQLEVNSSKTMSNKGLVVDGPRFLLPTEFTVGMGHIEVNGEVGRNVVRDGDDEWIYGVSTEITMGRGLELLGELRRAEEPRSGGVDRRARCATEDHASDRAPHRRRHRCARLARRPTPIPPLRWTPVQSARAICIRSAFEFEE